MHIKNVSIVVELRKMDLEQKLERHKENVERRTYQVEEQERIQGKRVKMINCLIGEPELN